MAVTWYNQNSLSASTYRSIVKAAYACNTITGQITYMHQNEENVSIKYILNLFVKMTIF